MAIDNQNPESDQKNNSSLGARFHAAREALGLERKDVANQLRLNEKIIIMMEKDRYAVDIPVMFVRGYIRSYAKFLQIPEYEITKTLERIQHKTIPSLNVPTLRPYKIDPPRASQSSLQILTVIAFTIMVGLAGTWYYTHHSATPLFHGDLALNPNGKLDTHLKQSNENNDKNLKANIIPIQSQHHAVSNTHNLANQLVAAHNIASKNSATGKLPTEWKKESPDQTAASL